MNDLSSNFLYGMVFYSISYNHRLLMRIVILCPASNVMDVVISSGILGVNTTIFSQSVFKNRWQSTAHRTMHKTTNQKNVHVM